MPAAGDRQNLHLIPTAVHRYFANISETTNIHESRPTYFESASKITSNTPNWLKFASTFLTNFSCCPPSWIILILTKNIWLLPSSEARANLLRRTCKFAIEKRAYIRRTIGMQSIALCPSSWRAKKVKLRVLSSCREWCCARKETSYLCVERDPTAQYQGRGESTFGFPLDVEQPRSTNVNISLSHMAKSHTFNDKYMYFQLYFSTIFSTIFSPTIYF